jgi:hypothetical protein
VLCNSPDAFPNRFAFGFTYTWPLREPQYQSYRRALKVAIESTEYVAIGFAVDIADHFAYGDPDKQSDPRAHNVSVDQPIAESHHLAHSGAKRIAHIGTHGIAHGIADPIAEHITQRIAFRGALGVTDVGTDG